MVGNLWPPVTLTEIENYDQEREHLDKIWLEVAVVTLWNFRMKIKFAVTTGFEITKKNHCDGDIYEHSFRL